MPFEFASLLSPAATNTAKPFSGYPPYHFVGGNIDEPTVPVDALADAVGKVIREKGHAMAKYGMDCGPQGDLSLREFVCNCLNRRNSMNVKPQEVLLTAGSLQAMDLVNRALLSKGDVVLLEAANYSGALSRLDALGVEYVGIELDKYGMRMDALERALSDLAANRNTSTPSPPSRTRPALSCRLDGAGKCWRCQYSTMCRSLKMTAMPTWCSPASDPRQYMRWMMIAG